MYCLKNVFRIIGIFLLLAIYGEVLGVSQKNLFPTNLPSSNWVEFNAEGFSSSVSGVIYRLKDKVSCGMPLGGIDTGCIDLGTSGLWGYCTIFNTHVPRRGPLNLPFLGISVGGQTWVLCDPAETRPYVAPYRPDASKSYPFPPGLPPLTLMDLSLSEVRTAQEIHYWGHYPVADLEYETDAPVSVGLRAWAPFLPGDIKNSLIPGSIFEVHLRNPGNSQQRGTLAFSFPGPIAGEAGASKFTRETVQGNFTGVVVQAKLASYALGVIDQENVRLGGELGADGPAWARIAEKLPEAVEEHSGASAAVDFSLNPGENKVVRFVLTWFAPTWKGGGYNWSEKGNTYTHTYAKYYPSALQAAQVLAREHQSLQKRVLAWQAVIYDDEMLPIWLRESLVNILHLITEGGLWPQAKPPIPDWVRPDDGLFGIIESPRACPNMECLPCTVFGQFPMVYFFPELALSNLRGYKGYQNPEGALPIVWGGILEGTLDGTHRNIGFTDFVEPFYNYQTTTNVPSYVAMLYRYWLITRDEAFLQEFYSSLKKATIFMVNLNRGPDGIISMPDRKVDMGPQGNTEWYEMYETHGMVSHTGGLHLVTLQMTQRLAEQAGDEAFARQCAEWLKAGSQSMEDKMWNGTNYLNFYEPAAGEKSEVVQAFQLDGQWMARSHGMAGVFRPDRVKISLDTIRRLNVDVSRYGAVSLVQPDGKWLRRDAVVVGVLMLAMNYMYDGQQQLGNEVAQNLWRAFVCEKGLTWDMPTEFNADTGERTSGGTEPAGTERIGGHDYANAPLLWALPAAMEDRDVSAPLAKPGGLVYRILKAAKGT